MFDIGNQPNLHFGNEESAATIIYNNGEIAIAGTAYSPELSDNYDGVHYKNTFLMTREEIQIFAPEIEDGDRYNSYIAIELKSGKLIEAHEWVAEGEVRELERNDAQCMQEGASSTLQTD